MRKKITLDGEKEREKEKIYNFGWCNLTLEF